MEFAIAFCALIAAHQVGDHWFGQSHHEALNKGGIGDHSAEGRRCAARHALKMAAHSAVFLVLAELFTGARFGLVAFTVAILVNSVSHYFIDRRWTLEWFANKTGKGDFYRLGNDTVNASGTRAFHIGTGAYALDQAAHWFFVFVSALILGL